MNITYNFQGSNSSNIVQEGVPFCLQLLSVPFKTEDGSFKQCIYRRIEIQRTCNAIVETPIESRVALLMAAFPRTSIQTVSPGRKFRRQLKKMKTGFLNFLHLSSFSSAVFIFFGVTFQL
jgi:hypothetical protein